MTKFFKRTQRESKAREATASPFRLAQQQLSAEVTGRADAHWESVPASTSQLRVWAILDVQFRGQKKRGQEGRREGEKKRWKERRTRRREGRKEQAETDKQTGR